MRSEREDEERRRMGHVGGEVGRREITFVMMVTLLYTLKTKLHLNKGQSTLNLNQPILATHFILQA